MGKKEDEAEQRKPSPRLGLRGISKIKIKDGSSATLRYGESRPKA